MTVETEIVRIANFLKYPIKGKLSYTEDNIIQMSISGNKKVVGFSSILNFFHNNQMQKNNQQSVQDFYLTKQFFDFANLFIRSTSKRDKCRHRNFTIYFYINAHGILLILDAACLELNEFLETRSYLIGQQISLADLAVFYALNDIMLQLSHFEKESYLNLSRWYSTLQSDDIIRQGTTEINFATIHLLGWNTQI